MTPSLRSFARTFSSARVATFASAAGQLLAFACVPLLSRVYTPEDFGGYVTFSTFYNLLNIALTGRYDQALQYAKSTREATRVLALATLVGGCAALASLAIAAGWGLLAGHAPGPSMLAWATLSALAASGTRVASFLFIRWGRHRNFAVLNFVRPASLSLVQLALGVVANGARTLALGHAIASTVTLLAALLQERRMRWFFRATPRQELRREAKRHRDFPLFTLPQNVLFVLSDASVPLLAAQQFGEAAGGLYWFAARITTAPMQVLVESVRPMINNGLVTAHRRGDDGAAFALRAALKLALPFCAGALLVALLGKPVFAWIFGEAWRNAGPISAVLFGYAAINAAGVPFIAALPIVQLQRLHLVVELGVLAAKGLAFYVFADSGPLACIAAGTGAAVLGYTCLYAVVWSTLRRHSAVGPHPLGCAPQPRENA